METRKMPRIDWAEVPMVFVTRPTCPLCGGESYDRSRTDSSGDGSSTKYCRCRHCDGLFKIIIESPETGEYEY
jgi:DNA-directed RNA polymerase subunit M/transcription elongation factor TFIIS